MYTKTSWVARVGTALNRFLKTNESAGSVELTNDPTGVSVPGTPFTVANMNKIEQGIYDAHYPEFTEAATLTNIASGEVQGTLWGKVKKAIATIISWLDQGVKTTDSPYFASVNTGYGANKLYPMNQGVRTTDSPYFANMSPPVDNNDATPPSIGRGGFTYAVGKGTDGLTLPSGGTYVVLALTISTGTSTGTGSIARLSGGTSKVFIGSNEDIGYLIMRIG